MILSSDRSTFDRITDTLYLGSRIASLDHYHRLRAHGIRACVDLKNEGADPWTFEAFLWLPTPDQDAPSPMHFAMGLSFLSACERAGLPAFVHCMAGIGRSTSLVLAYLLTGPFHGKGPSAALTFLAARRPVCNPNAMQVHAAVQAAERFVG